MKSKQLNSAALITSAILGASFSISVFAQDGSLALEEIVVTAQKREESVQDIPVSVSAISAATIEKLGISNTSDLVKVSPSLTVTESNSKTNSAFSIRGIGTNTFGLGLEQAVALIVDDVAMVNQGQSLASLIDIERIEVLRGPQSTLFGKSASAGVISVTTKQPDNEMTAQLELDATNEESYRATASVSGPIADTLGFRLTGYWRDMSAYVDNLSPGSEDFNSEESEGLRAKLHWDVTDTLSVTVGGYYNHETGQCCTAIFRELDETALFAGIIPVSLLTAGVVPGEENTTVRYDTLPNQKNKSKGLNIRASFAIGDFDLISITAHDQWDYGISEDVDFSDFDFLSFFTGGFASGGFYSQSARSSDYFSQEFRLVSPAYDTYDYVVGLFYSDSDIEKSFYRNIPVALGDNDTQAENEGYAVFGQLNLHLTDRTSVGIGLRYLEEKIKGRSQDHLLPGSPEVSGSADDEAVVGKVYLRHAVLDDAMIFASYARGYKGPAFDLSSFDEAKAQNPVAPEISDAYELGIKSSFLDNRVQLNATAFYTEYDDFQVQGIDGSSGVVEFNLLNVGSLETQGLELETAARLTETLTLSVNAAYTDATVNDYVGPCYNGQTVAQGCISGVQTVNGGTLPNAPEWKYTAILDYQKPLASMPFDLFANASYLWQSETRFDINQGPRTVQDSYGVADLRLGIADKAGRYEITAYVNNLFDEFYVGNLGDFSFLYGGSTALVHMVPRNAQRFVGLNCRFFF